MKKWQEKYKNNNQDKQQHTYQIHNKTNRFSGQPQRCVRGKLLENAEIERRRENKRARERGGCFGH